MRLKHVMHGAASAVVLMGLSAGASAAYAQDDDTVGELIVTAQKREQRLQDVPIVVTVVGEQLLEDAGVKDIRELTVLTPGLIVTATSNETIVTARIRGVGSVADNPGIESSVGVVIDGVYRPRNGVAFGDLGQVSRIEVLKGPQGTLFGKNTSAGVISIITKEPSFTPSTELELTAGNFDAYGATVYATGPLAADKLAGSFYAGVRERSGLLEVKSLGASRPTEDNTQNFWTLRGQLLALPNDQFSARIIADYTKREESCCAATQLQVGQATAGNRATFVNTVKPGSLDLTNTPFDRVAYANRGYGQTVEDRGVSLEAAYDLGNGAEITSISAWREWRSEVGQDSDFTAADLIWRPEDGTNFTRFSQLSQELRVAGESGRLNWLVGGFVANEDLETRLRLNYGSDFYAYWDARVLSGAPSLLGLTSSVIHQVGSGSDDTHFQEDTTFAFFTNNDFAITDKLTFTGGLRYTRDEKNVTSRYTTSGGSCVQAESLFGALAGAVGAATAGSVVGGLCTTFMNAKFDALGPVDQAATENETSGTAKLAYRFSDQVMAYASYSRGYKAGVFNLDREAATCAPGPIAANAHPVCKALGVVATPRFMPDPQTHLAPEIVDSYEIGFKSQLLNDTLLFNVTAFDQTFTDFQLNTFVGISFVTATLPEVTSQGVDVDILWRTPIQGLSIQGGGVIADTLITKFTVADFAVGADFNSISALSDRRLGFAPRYTGSLAATYEMPVGEDMEWRSNISAKYNSGYSTASDLLPAKKQKEFVVVNARVGYGRQDDGWRIELWSQNLLDEDYLQVGFNGPLQMTTNPAPAGQNAVAFNDTTSVYDAFLGAPRTFGLTLRAKLK